MLGVLAKSTIIFDWSLGGFTQSLELWAQLVENWYCHQMCSHSQ
jgi:hypothetical protein